MGDYPKEVTLKSGDRILLRLLEEDDLESLVEYFRSLPPGDRMYLRTDVAKKENILRRFGDINYDKDNLHN